MGSSNIPRLYVGAMNDAVFVIDQPPRPSTDEPVHDREVNVVAACGTDQQLAEKLAAAWNAVLDQERP